MGLNLVLFFTASWHTTPYFLGPDLVFSFAWLPFVLTGASGQPALDNVEWHPSAATLRRISLRPADEPLSEEAASASTRRALLVQFAGMALGIAGISALLKGPYHAPRALAAVRRRRRHAGAGSEAAGAAPQGAARIPPGAVKLGPANRLPARIGRHLHGSRRWLGRHPDPRARRQPQGVQRGLHPRRLHGRLRRRRHLLPLPRRRVRPRNGCR